jgi:hypothetical protein
MIRSTKNVLAMVVAAAVTLLCGTSHAQKKPSTNSFRQIVGKTETVKVPMATLSAEMMRNPTPQTPAAAGEPRPMHDHNPPEYKKFKDEANRRKQLALSHRRSNSLSRQLHSPQLSNPATLGAVFAGLNFADTTCGCLPPDTIAAAGPDYIVETVNTAIRVYDKVGNNLFTEELGAFFAPLGTGSGGDPQVIYDQADNRFIVESFNGTYDGLNLAVSIDSNPLDGFYEWSIASPAGLPDFAKIGVSQSAVYISDDLFPNSGTPGAELRVVQLSDLLVGNPSLTITYFPNVQTASGYNAWAIEPALTYGNTQNEYLVGAAAPYFVSPTDQLNLFSINTSGTPVLTAMDLSVPAWSEPPSADQPGSPSSVATDSSFLLNAVWNNGVLVSAHNVASADLSAAVAQYFVISLPDSIGLAGASLSDTGTVGVGDTYYPAISVRSDGQVAMVYNESSTTEYISAYAAGRLPTDPAGVMAPAIDFSPGLVTQTYSFRWGDYSGISLDPVNNSFWMAAEPALADAPSVWQTEIANVQFQQSSTTTLTSHPNPSMFNQPVTFTATITPSLGGTATGTVYFYDNGNLIGSGTVASNSASFTTNTLRVGSHAEIEAAYIGDANVASSLSGDLVQRVKKATTATVVVSSLNPSHVGQSVTFTATVTPIYGGTPTGTVTFKLGTAVLGTGTLSGGKTTLSTSSLPAGTDKIKAVYGGSTNFNASTGGVTQLVTP